MTHAHSESMVKACLFLIVAVALADDATCAASSPGCPSKMQADANTLLQTGVRIGDELAPGQDSQGDEGRRAETHAKKHSAEDTIKVTSQLHTELDTVKVTVAGGDHMPRPDNWDILVNSTAAMDLPKILWMFWSQGNVNTTAPPLNKVCFHNWPALNPGWTYNLVTSGNIASLAPEMDELFQSVPRTVQLRSDMLRLALLAEHGGVWADGSLLPLRGLDAFVNQLVEKSGFFAFTYPTDEDPFTHYDHPNDPFKTLISSWFMVSKPKNPLVLAWLDAFKEKWKDPHANFEYFQVHFTLKDLILKKDPRVAEVWESMPRISSWWPQQCTVHGCPGFWQNTDASDLPPVMKRPYQDLKVPPEDFMQGYATSFATAP